MFIVRQSTPRRLGRRVAVGALMLGIQAGMMTTAYCQQMTPGRGMRMRSSVPPVPAPASEYELLPFRERSIRDYSWVYIDSPRPRQIMMHDLVTIIVDEKSEVTLRSGFDRQRTANLKAELKEFLRIGKGGRLSNAARNQPTVDANLTSRMQTSGRVTNQEGIRFRITATVVDVLPNGVVVLYARKSIRTDRDVWQISLTGLIRSQDIRRDNTALSEHFANMVIVKKRGGKVYDSTKRPWGIRLYDLLSPF